MIKQTLRLSQINDRSKSIASGLKRKFDCNKYIEKVNQLEKEVLV
jgi:hypothetical protein